MEEIEQTENGFFRKGAFFRQGGPGRLLRAENRMFKRSQTSNDLEERDSGRGAALPKGMHLACLRRNWTWLEEDDLTVKFLQQHPDL